MARCWFFRWSIPAVIFWVLAWPLAPGALAAGFSRGDSNLDGQLQLSDAVFTLGFLFLGSPTVLDCEDAADANDDGSINLSDAVSGLGYLFLGTAPPPAPFPACGEDPTDDALGCVSYPLCKEPLRRASKSSTIAISPNDRWLVATNPADNSITIFDTTMDFKSVRVATGREPSSVVVHPDGLTAFVANRADATVVKISKINEASPEVSSPVGVGSEPAGLALTPSGRTLFVTEFAEGRVSAIDTESLQITGVIEAPQNPRALVVTNDGDGEDSDELLILPEFFGEPVPGGETTDTGRKGRVRIYRVSDLSPTTPIILNPLDSGFSPAGIDPPPPTVMTSPNQLSAVTVDKGKIYLASVSASPAPPIRFNTNVQPVVYVGDLGTRSEDRGPLGTTNLAKEVRAAIPEGSPRLFLADIVDLDFFGSTGVLYVVSRGADAVQRVSYQEGASAVEIGTPLVKQIDVLAAPAGSDDGCLAPNGIVTANNSARAFINCWVNQRVGVIDLDTQTFIASVETAPLPSSGEAVSIRKGRRFFFTGRARWANSGWSSCGSCHPDGLTDNITWSFGAGPRQTTSMDGSFSHGVGQQKQRIFNWTGIFDELHDFERNTRGVSGGLGAITTSATGMCGTLSAEAQDPATPSLPGNLAQPIKELQDRPENCTKNWDDIDNFVKTIRPPGALRFLDPASVARGAALFGEPSLTAENGGCVRCHGGGGWTVSRRFFTPSTPVNTALDTAPFVAPPFWPVTWNLHTQQIDPQPAAADNTGAVVAPAQVACVIRDLETFGVPGDATATDALEKKDNGTRAQGAGGYNVPSLYGLSLGTPYLHHGQARTLQDLFTDPLWAEHAKAGNPTFLTTGDVARDRADLINFLLSIDAETAEQDIPPGWDGCPADGGPIPQ